MQVALTQSVRVEYGSLRPFLSKRCICRYSGRWSAYLSITTCASKPGPAIAFSSGLAGNSSINTPSPPALAYLIRLYCFTYNSPGWYSNTSVISSPIFLQPFMSAEGSIIISSLRRLSGSFILPGYCSGFRSVAVVFV